jgi:hypothetical protein
MYIIAPGTTSQIGGGRPEGIDGRVPMVGDRERIVGDRPEGDDGRAEGMRGRAVSAHPSLARDALIGSPAVARDGQDDRTGT